MKRNEALEVNQALNSKELKVKFLTGPQYVSLIGFKRPLIKYIQKMGEDEKELFEAHDVVTNDQLEKKMIEDKSFAEKVKLIQSPEFTPKETKFIPLDEFKKFTDEVDVATGILLAEYLLKSD